MHKSWNLTTTVASMVYELDYNHLPQNVIEKTKLLILDHIGCSIGGSNFKEAARLRTYLEKIDPGGMCTVYGGRNMTAENAAHINAHSACMLSLDDSYIRFGHPGCSILPSALAVAQKQNSTGRDLITAVVAAYEMSLRLGIAAQASPQREEIVKGNSSWQIFGTTVAVSKLYGFTVDEICSAFGMTALHAPPPFLRKFHSRPMNSLKNNYGWACKAGITSVELVRAGFKGNHAIFDGPDGYWAMMGSDQFDVDKFIKPYSEKSYVMDIGFKAYSGCRWSHTAIDCIRHLMEQENVTSDNLETLKIETVGEFVRELDGDWPDTTVDALFRTSYLVALELHHKSSALGLNENDLSSMALKQTVKKIEMLPLDGADQIFFQQGKLPARLTAKLKNGRLIQTYSDLPTGHPEGPPFDQPEVIHKFLALTTSTIGENTADLAVNHVLNLEKQKCIQLP